MSSFSEKLLPGIPDEVTLTHIATKLPWEAFEVLSSVSLSWEQAIKSREVYGERIRCDAREELLIFERRFNVRRSGRVPRGYQRAFGLYSARLKDFYGLPPLSHRHDYFTICQMIASNGSLYVCCHKSFKTSEGHFDEEIQVYVLNVAGLGPWKECAPECAPCFRCGLRLRKQHKYIAAECTDQFNSMWSIQHSFVARQPSQMLAARDIPQTWVTLHKNQSKVGAKEFLMRVSRFGNCHIYVSDTNRTSWRLQHSISCDDIAHEIGPQFATDIPLEVNPLFVVQVGNELLATVRWNRAPLRGYELLQSEGFGTDRKEITWQKISHSFDVGPEDFEKVCPLLL